MRRPLVFLHIALNFFMCCTPGMSAPPAWWTSGNPPVIDPAATVNNKGPANIGQAKWMAKNALDALRAVSPATADAVEGDLVKDPLANPPEDKPIGSWDAPTTPEEQAAQKAPLLIGQLKAISAPFYHHLNLLNPAWLENERMLNVTAITGTHFPWTVATTDDANKAVATIGQLKAVFSLRFETLFQDEDQDGLPDDWEIQYFGGITAYGANDDPDGDGFTNLQAHQQGFQPVAPDSDSDGVSNKDDADPNDSLVDWRRTPHSNYLWVQVDGVPQGYKSVDINDKGQILFKNTTLADDPDNPLTDRVKTEPIGKIWDPSKQGAARWTDVFFNPAPFKLKMWDYVGETVVLRDVRIPLTLDPFLEAVGSGIGNDFRLVGIGDDGSVMIDCSISHSEYDGHVESPLYSGGGRFVFLWQGQNYSTCKIVGGEDRGVRSEEGYTNNYGAGFHTIPAQPAVGGNPATNAVVRAVMFDQDYAFASPTGRTDVTLRSYTMGGAELGEPQTFSVQTSRDVQIGYGGFNAFLPSQEFTSAGRIILPKGTASEDYSVAGVGSAITLPATMDWRSIIEFPPSAAGAVGRWGVGGGWEGTDGGPLRIWKNGGLQATQANGVLQFDKAGTGIGDGAGGRDIWCNGEWRSLAEATGINVENLPDALKAKKITPSGVIWAQSSVEAQLGILVPINVNSIDRFVKGSVNIELFSKIFGSSETLGIEITGKDSEKEYGLSLLSEGYVHHEGFLNSEEEAAQAIQSIEEASWRQDAIFYRKGENVVFMTTFDQAEEISIGIKINGQRIGEVKYALVAMPEVSDLIDVVAKTFSEMPFLNDGEIPSQYIEEYLGVEYERDFPSGEPLGLNLLSMRNLTSGNIFSDEGQRNLTTRCMEAFFDELQKQAHIAGGKIAEGGEVVVKYVAGYATGYVRGIWGGLKSDWEGLVELKNLLLHPIDTTRGIYEGFKSLLGLNLAQWEALTKSMYNSMISSAEQSLPWKYEGDNVGDQLGLITHISGRATGFVSEQALMIYLGAGAVSKIGQSLKAITLLAKSGQLAAGLVSKGIRSTVNVVRKIKASAQRCWSQFVLDSEHLERISGVIERIHRRPGMPGYNGSFENSARALAEAFEIPEVNMSRILDGLGNKAKFKELDTPDFYGRTHLGQFLHRLGQIAILLKKADCLSDDALRGFARLYPRLVKDVPVQNGVVIRERVNDMLKLFDSNLPDINASASNPEAAKALARSLEDFKATTDADVNAKFAFKEVDKVYNVGYRYSNFDPRFDKDGILIPGDPTLRISDAPSPLGWHVSFDKFDGSAAARQALQLPAGSAAKYRLDFDVTDVKDNLNVPRGDNGASAIFEPLCRDFPELSTVGGGRQCRLDGKDVKIKAVWDISQNPPIKIY